MMLLDLSLALVVPLVDRLDLIDELRVPHDSLVGHKAVGCLGRCRSGVLIFEALSQRLAGQ